MAVASTGFFDGVHLGHRAVIQTLVRDARERGDESLVITFWPHPRTVLGLGEPQLLNSLEEKLDILKSLGVDRIEVIPFTREFASLPAEGYIRKLKEDYGVTRLVLGYDNRLGSDQKGPAESAALCDAFGIGSVIVPPVMMDGKEISSTRIRKAFAEGDVSSARKMLSGDERK